MEDMEMRNFLPEANPSAEAFGANATASTSLLSFSPS